jgi:antitoxin HicB
MKKLQGIGSSFDDFLEEEGLLADAQAVAIKRVVAFQVQQAMEQKNISKSAMAKKMGTSRSSLDRLLDPFNTSVTLATMESAILAIGKRMSISIA